jgi:phosphoglycerate dehydrogenase-like enzyme
MAESTPRVLVTAMEYGKAADTFAAAPDVVCVQAPEDEVDLAQAIRDERASAVVVGARAYSGPLYEALPRGGVIARFGVGHDGIDKAKATSFGLLCTNTPGVLDQSVAELTMLLIGAAARGLVPASVDMTRRLWKPVVGTELRGTTLVVVGCGGIGRAVGRIASLGFGMRVVGCLRANMVVPAAIDGFERLTNDFNDAVRGADFVSLHMSASRENAQWMDGRRLAALGAGTWLINTARGWMVDEAALFDALLERRLAGAALDVFAEEPYAPADGRRDLRTLANVILTPHVGSHTVAANRRIAERALQNIRLARGGSFGQIDLLNPEALSA